MADTPHTLRVEREDHDLVILEGLELARSFFKGDPSAAPGGYDSLVGTGNVDRINRADVEAVNRSMRARSSHAWWEPVIQDEQKWLSAIPVNLDLVQADDDSWKSSNGENLLLNAIRRCIHPHIGLATSTKVLHLKRPAFFPVLDEIVVQMRGVNLPDSPTLDQRVAIAQRISIAIRREARRNLNALLQVQTRLAHEGIHRSLVRIFDASLWFAHPATGVPDATRELHVAHRTPPPPPASHAIP